MRSCEECIHTKICICREKVNEALYWSAESTKLYLKIRDHNIMYENLAKDCVHYNSEQ